MQNNKKPTVVFDFDGVIHSYTSGWKGASVIPDPPVPGIREVIEEVREKYKVVVVSSRCSTQEGINAIHQWLEEWFIDVDEVTMEKPPAIVYIDDRAICFDGNNVRSLISQIDDFEPWYRR